MTRHKHSLLKLQKSAWVLTAVFVLGSSAHAENLVTNGSFESFTGGHNGAPSQVAAPTTYAGEGYTTLTGWQNAGYAFLYAPGEADTTGAYSPEFSTGVYLWGPSNTNPPNSLTVSPDGGNYVSSDPVFQLGPLQQTLLNLVLGQQYTVSFYYAGAQQAPTWFGPTTEGWQVSFISDNSTQTQSTQILNDTSQGFTGWYTASMNFTADSTTETLSFLALGSPEGLPPFALIDGVDVEATPEPGTWVLVLAGIACIGFFRARTRFNS